jgi:hypothetical protein
MNEYTLKQWKVPSGSNPNKKYTVSLVRDALTDVIDYQCSCPGWTTHVPRKHCKHIRSVLDGDLDAQPEIDYEILPGNVGQVTVKENKTILAPLIPLDDKGTYVLATIVYDLAKLGVPMKKIKERFHMIPKEWTKDVVIGYIQSRGRYVYTEWIQGKGWCNPEWIPVLDK